MIWEFLLLEENLICRMSPRDMAVCSNVSVSMYSLIRSSLVRYRLQMLRPYWNSRQRSAWLAVRSPSLLLFWAVDEDRCMLCLRPWYSYRRPLIQSAPLYCHDICLFKHGYVVKEDDAYHVLSTGPWRKHTS